jgi:DNA-binding response OmpR family regulator
MTSLSGRRILLAEDDESARHAVAHALRALGADVIETSDGGRMLVAITSQYKDGRTPQELDLIIADVRMPVVSGIDVFKGLRAAAWRTPVIIVTAYDTPEVRDVVDRFGAVLLLKPFELEDLERAVEGLLFAANRGRPS